MMKIAVVGCTGRLGSLIMKNILERDDVSLAYAIGRNGNRFVGQDISAVIGGNDRNITIISDISAASDCDVFIDCTNAGAFIQNNLPQYRELKKAVVIATTAFNDDDKIQINNLATEMPVFMTGNSLGYNQ